MPRGIYLEVLMVTQEHCRAVYQKAFLHADLESRVTRGFVRADTARVAGFPDMSELLLETNYMDGGQYEAKWKAGITKGDGKNVLNINIYCHEAGENTVQRMQGGGETARQHNSRLTQV